MQIAQSFDNWESGAARPERSPSRPGSRLGKSVALGAMVALNWYAAAQWPSTLFSVTSMLLFVWMLTLVGRISPAGFVLLLPLVITRGATMLSLAVIETGAYMPEINRIGQAGDASASFVAFTAWFFLLYAVLFRALEPWFLRYVRSPMIDEAVRLLGWPLVLACAALGAVVFVQGLAGGFPLLEGVDRFLYRRERGGPLVVLLLDNKFLVAALLGTIAFAPRHAPMMKLVAKLVFVALTGLYFLFADKFFTILAETAFFAMPLLLIHRDRLGTALFRTAPAVIALLCGTLGATVYIYSDYGRLPVDRTARLLGERIAGQGQLWFVATRDDREVTAWNGQLADRYTRGLGAAQPAAAAFNDGVETYYFIGRYSPAQLIRNFRQSGGWVQLVMGTEAMALVMFGWVGVIVIMGLCAVLVAIASLFLRRALASGFFVSVLFATWVYLQVYFSVQQASLWSVAAPGQINRFLLFVTLELLLLAANRGQIRAMVARAALARHRQAVAA